MRPDEIYIGKIYETIAAPCKQIGWQVVGFRGSDVMVKRLGKSRPPILIPLRDFAALVRLAR